MSNETATAAVAWKGTVSDDEQSKAPLNVGVALILGVLLWMGPYMGVNGVLLPARVAQLVGDQKATVLALLSTSAMIVAAIANIVFGALSDLTRSRWGRRTPWIVCGAVLSGLTLLLLNVVTSVPVLVAVWCLYQLFLNAVVAPLIAVLADRVAPKNRGMITSFYALGYSVGIYGGQMVAAPFVKNVSGGIVILAIAAMVGGPLAAVLMREKSSLDMPKGEFTWKIFAQHFAFPTKNCRDYYLALVAKFLIVAAKFTVAGVQLYILTDYMKQTADGASGYLKIINLCMMVTAIGMTLIAAPVSDRIGSRKLPVVACAVFVAAGSLVPFFSANPSVMIAFALLVGIGMGMFNAVDQALNVDVLPDPDTAAKDLGIINLANTGGQVVGPVVAASVIAVWGYQGLFPISACFAIVGGILILFIKKVK
ncbi:MFS transporter [Alloscardovia venturai]|uniref:MFS transporter n=1 Tax=Alloscardovia venturai TaxID=1769421 RepID=A0ABW2Y1V3_9BIFI